VQEHKKYSPSNDHTESECIDRYPASDVDNGVHRRESLDLRTENLGGRVETGEERNESLEGRT
jgi:hypothetical protein